MNALTCVLVVLGAAALSEGRRFVFENRRGETVWVGALGNAGKGQPNGGGWEMRPGASVTVDVDDSWAGRFWGRTGCGFDGAGNGRCRTGDCGRLQCNGAGGQPPATLAEITLGGWGGQDFYDISLVDGFNIPVTMNALTCLLLLLALAATGQGRTFVFVNQGSQTVWVGSLGNAGIAPPNGGGWEMAPGSTVTLELDDAWAGRFWGRTGCSFDGSGRGSCQTGDCGGVLQCNGAGGVPPVTLAEVTLGGWGGNDYYDISLVDGFNIPVTMVPTDVSGGGDHYRCNAATCPANVNAQCPSELQVVANGAVVACKSACLAFNTDQYCCRGAYGTPDTCQSSTWPVNYPAFFKGLCPDAYSYAYDDVASTFTCASTGYKITFG